MVKFYGHIRNFCLKSQQNVYRNIFSGLLKLHQLEFVLIEHQPLHTKKKQESDTPLAKVPHLDPLPHRALSFSFKRFGFPFVFNTVFFFGVDALYYQQKN